MSTTDQQRADAARDAIAREEQVRATELDSWDRGIAYIRADPEIPSSWRMDREDYQWAVAENRREAEAEVDKVAAQDRAERADPATSRIVDARDEHAAGGRFDLADATQRVIDSIRAGRNEQQRPDPRHLRCYGSEPRDRGVER